MTNLSGLAATLGVSEQRLAALADHSDADVTSLDALIVGAMKREDAEFDAGLDEALRFVPALVRPAAKKMLFGGSRRG